MTSIKFLELLVNKGFLEKTHIDPILKEVEKESLPLEKVILKYGVENKDLRSVKSLYYRTPAYDLLVDDVHAEIVKRIPEETARLHKMVAFGVDESGALLVGMLDPRDIEAQNVLQFITSENGTLYNIFVITQLDYENILEKYKGLSGEISDVLDEYSDVTKAALAEAEADNRGKPKAEIIKEDAPVTKMVAAIVKHAVQEGASDIHVEIDEDKVRVRFRVDGVLNTYLEVPKKVHSAIIARIKIMTKTMKLDERRKPQDGRFPAMIDGRKIDFRVSIMPTFFGEKVVIRILDSQKGIRKLAKLGLSKEQEEMIRYAIERPHGLILITGPTGSGKTTTLYSMLGEVDRETKNVVSLEDPVEYQFPGVNQSQVRADIGYTFAEGLRSIVRQDPDVIMVGEIRDKETANLAIQAALTGHLVFATLHTNSSFGIIPRLVEMGVDPYLIAPTLILGVAQRLLRRIASGAAVPVEEHASIRAMVDEQFADLPAQFKEGLGLERNLYQVKPTKEAPSGMKGRVAILEMFKVDKEIEKIILENPTEQAIYESARKKGMITLREAAILKGFEGLVPFSEINEL